jgi:cyclase
MGALGRRGDREPVTATYFQRVSEPMPRVIAALTMQDGRLVRTRGFKKPSYVGDPINAVKIFNDKGTDELVLLEIGDKPFDDARVQYIRKVAGEAFMPISYGGGVRTIEHVRAVIRSGFEKVVLNTALHRTPALAGEAAREFGAQAVVASIEVARGFIGGSTVRTECGRRNTGLKPVDWARKCEEIGCGEIVLTSIDRDGSMEGYDLDLVRDVSAAVSIPVIALGGAGTVEHLREGIAAGASAVAAGSMFVYYGPRRAVLINYPNISAIHD